MKEDVIKKRHAISLNYCNERGWNMNDLSFDQIVEIRELQEWKDATIGLIN